MSSNGWTPEDLEQLAQRTVDVADEAFGPFPVQTPAEAMTAIEKGIFEQRQSGETMRQKLHELETFAEAHGNAVGFDEAVLFPRVVLDIIRRKVP
jgi:hypothetical protein